MSYDKDKPIQADRDVTEYTKRFDLILGWKHEKIRLCKARSAKQKT